MLVAVHLQGHPKTRLYWPTPGYSEQTTFGSHHWSILFKSNNMGVSGFPTKPPHKKRKKKQGHRHAACVCFPCFFVWEYSYVMKYSFYLHIFFVGKKHARELTCPPFFMMFLFPKKGPKVGKGVSCSLWSFPWSWAPKSSASIFALAAFRIASESLGPHGFKPTGGRWGRSTRLHPGTLAFEAKNCEWPSHIG